MKKTKTICLGSFKALEIAEVEDDQITPSLQQFGPPEGTENVICVVAVSSIGEIKVITQINQDKARWYYSEECQEYIETDFDEPPGLYLVEFWIEGSRDYEGEYDSWSEFGEIIKYKINVEDRRNSKFEEEDWRNNFESKIYEDPGSEYPRCLFIVDDTGKGFILDFINGDKAYKSIIKESIQYMHDIDLYDGITSLRLYEADFSIDGDMENILDRDEDEGLKMSNIKRVPLILEDKLVEILSRKDKRIEIFCKYVDELKMKDEHIK